MKTRRILILLLCLFFLGRPHLTKAEDLEKIAVTLPENAVVAGTRLFLGEIAEISGEGELAAQVKEANVGTAPRPGDWRRLTKGQIEVRLRQAGLDLKKIEFLGTQAVRVYGLAEDMPSAENNDPPALQVIVLQRDVSRGEILTAADLAAEEKEIGYGSRQAGSLSDFLGLRARRSLSAGTVLSEAHVEVVPAVERGAWVKIIADTGSILVTVPGTARGTGNVGDVIAVENSVSRRIVYGEILDGETVRVIVGGSDGA